MILFLTTKPQPSAPSAQEQESISSHADKYLKQTQQNMPNPQPSAPSRYEPEFAVQAYAVDTDQSISNRGRYSNHKVRDSVIGGAAVAGGVVGLLIAGHVFALVGALGACVLATQNNMAGGMYVHL